MDENQIVAAYCRGGRSELLTAKDLVLVFKDYSDSFDSYMRFVNAPGIATGSVYRPNCILVKFLYDPITGNKIDWSKFIKDYFIQTKSFAEINYGKIIEI